MASTASQLIGHISLVKEFVASLALTQSWLRMERKIKTELKNKKAHILI